MKPQQPHTLPEGWEHSTVGKSLQICNSLRLPISEEERQKVQGNYPYYGPTKIQDYIDYYRIEGRYALIGEDGDHFLKYRDQEMTLLVDGKFNVNNHAHIVQGTDICTTEWFHYYFAYKDLFTFLTRQGAGRYKLTKAALGMLPIALPPLPEQRRIATVLGTWDRAIEQTTDLLRQLRVRHRGLMQRLLTGKVRLPGFEGEWQHVELGDLFERVNRRNAEGNTNVLTISAQQGLVSQGRYFNKNIASEVVTNYFLLHRGEFAYNKSYSAGYPMGVLKRLEQYEKGIVSTLYICFRLRDNAENDASFFVHFFEAGCLNQNISEIAQEGARNHGLLNVGVGDFFGVRLVVPTHFDEQHAIAQVLDASLREIRQQEAKLDALREQKRGLMQCLLTGKVRVPDSTLAQESI